MLAVHTSSNGGVRISRVERGGEEVINADTEAKLLAAMLWTKLGQKPLITTPVFPQLEAAVAHLAQLRDEVHKLNAQCEKTINQLRTLLEQAEARPPRPTPVRGQ